LLVAPQAHPADVWPGLPLKFFSFLIYKLHMPALQEARMSNSSLSDASDARPAKRRPGRPTGGDMTQLTLRLPREHMLALIEESTRLTVETGRNVTPQAVIASMVAAGLASRS
jgi:hypothetical protein